LQSKATLIELRAKLGCLSFDLALDSTGSIYASARISWLAYLGSVLLRLDKLDKAEPNQPSRDRQDDIIAAIISRSTPLTRPELVDQMRLKTEGKLGHHLAWMVNNGKLVNIPGRGYWPADRAMPK
jgi:hypothetical protein